MVIYIGLDDTDVVDSPGTNQLARQIASQLSDRYTTQLILRHQLLDDPRVPYTSQNGSASLVLTPNEPKTNLSSLFDELAATVKAWSPPGSDPGLCLTEHVPEPVQAFGLRCQRELMTQADARSLAAQHGIRLEGLGGTQGGVIGALAAVGLVAGGNDGRVLHVAAAGRDYYDVTGTLSVAELHALGIAAVQCQGEQQSLASGSVRIPKRLRPNLRGGRVVLFVAPIVGGAVHEFETVKVK